MTPKVAHLAITTATKAETALLENEKTNKTQDLELD
jgi:hypothetical protein